MCGEPPAPMGEEELATTLMRLVERKGILLGDDEARNFIRKFKKEYKRFPDEKDLVRAADELVKVDSMSKQELKAKAIVDKKRQKETMEKGKTGAEGAVPARKETELDLTKKIEELRQKRALEKQQQLELAKAKAAPVRVTPPVEEEVEAPEETVTSPPSTPAAPPHAPPVSAPAKKGKCPKCGASNPPDSMFCLECGEKIVGEAKPAAAPTATKGEVICPKCKSSNPPGSTFCLECGASMGPEAKPTPASVSSKGEVICPKCKSSNPQGSGFCLDCGEKIETAAKPAAGKGDAVCPGCKHVNPPGSRFCLNCGNPM